MHLPFRARTTRLPTSLFIRHYYKFRPRPDTPHVGKFVVSTLLTFGSLGFGFYALRNTPFDGFRSITLGLAHDTAQNPIRHVHENTIESDAASFPSDIPISLASSYGGPDDVEKAIQELRHAFPGQHRVRTNKDSLKFYGSSENSYLPSSPHSVVVQVKSTEDVVKVVNISRKYRIPLVPYSGATSLEGHFSGVSICYPPLALVSKWNACLVSLGEHMRRSVDHGSNFGDTWYVIRRR